MREALPTTVSVNELRVDEADFEIVQHGWLVEVAERCEVILAHQDVRVSQVRQVLCFGVQEVLEALRTKHTCLFFLISMHNRPSGSWNTDRTCKLCTEKPPASRFIPIFLLLRLF